MIVEMCMMIQEPGRMSVVDEDLIHEVEEEAEMEGQVTHLFIISLHLPQISWPVPHTFVSD